MFHSDQQIKVTCVFKMVKVSHKLLVIDRNATILRKNI